MTRVCVVGCGAVGSLFAAHLGTLDDVEVWAYDVVADHVAAINESGLRLTGRADVLAKVNARTQASEIPPCEFGIVATKSMYTADAIAAAAPIFADGAVCSVQNGVGNEELIAEHVPRVMRGTTFPAGRVTAPGVVQMDTAGDTWIGPFEDRPASMEEVERLADAMTRGGMPTKALADARGAQWTKLIFNAASNPLGALTALTQGRLCEFAPTRALISGIVAEGVAVAAALGITLDSDPEALVDHSAEVAYDHRASMLQDALAHRRTEIEALNGGIVRFGSENGIPTPLNEAVLALILGMERAWTSQPEGEH
ncbi:MAG TPA: ketopantoate reductase family protein [Solirubrobacteraceae bacterium]|jgi:2-dehydropantoate 2-reductase|nr:ketopantoate reductase family protein [Solirubrobacteraceae bacterium]